MIEETGIVRIVEGNTVWIETTVKSTCGSCHASENCGTSVIAKAFTNKPELLKLQAPDSLVVGQRVKLGVPESQLLSASMLVYILPLFALIFAVVLLQSLLPSAHEIWQVGLGFTAMAMSFYALRRRELNGKQKHFSPIILGAVNEDTVTMKNEIPLKKLS
ncbi:MAG: SoxR reducing system RseC family protein [Glaciecola sp.]|jgi:sigma-E factor negative regulatory protein RseC